MTSLPIVARELVVAARHPRTFWARVGSVFLGLCLLLYVLKASENSPAADIGRYLFWSLSSILSLFCLVGGFRLTSDSISSEKREGTLGLLFLTDLKGYDVVLGKLAATSLNAIYRLLALTPLITPTTQGRRRTNLSYAHALYSLFTASHRCDTHQSW